MERVEVILDEKERTLAGWNCGGFGNRKVALCDCIIESSKNPSRNDDATSHIHKNMNLEDRFRIQPIRAFT